LLILLLSLSACVGNGGKDDTAITRGDAAAGAIVFTNACAVCHGAKGEGGSGPGMADVVPGLTDGDIVDTVQNGSGDMAAVSIDDTDLSDVLAYLRDTWGE
jgi:mono/diheme cytochrome c family protein